MNAIEFQTTITDPFIQIPNYKEFENREVRVIVLDTMQSVKKKKINDTDQIDSVFDRYSLDVASYHFDRDEANAR